MARYINPELSGMVLEALADGPIESKAGRATALLVEFTDLHRLDQGYAMRLALEVVRDLERAGLVERDHKPGRTYRIALAGR